MKSLNKKERIMRLENDLKMIQEKSGKLQALNEDLMK